MLINKEVKQFTYKSVCKRRSKLVKKPLTTT